MLLTGIMGENTLCAGMQLSTIAPWDDFNISRTWKMMSEVVNMLK